ncbi:MAG: hypothetical protein A2W28_08460 [Gammaproteobacteria bacterium RBG_16_51_14]|nr:MAG: hypothetical protein A2W28_08460 [Gammaproteobacteria bacterium RBG_16_51_14]
MNVEEQSATEQNRSNQSRIHRIKRDQLPLHCPTPEMSLWDSHPRVYLPIRENVNAMCPYCGSEYALAGD